jgi:hypothetical protein
MSIPPHLRASLLAAVLGTIVSSAHAVTLDWNTQTWPSGALSNSYDVDPTKPGNDITITITGDTNILAADPANPGTATPTVNHSLEGGFGSPPNAQNSLLFHLDSVRPTDAITITITFSAQYMYGAQNISFTLGSIDKNSYRDRVTNISGLGVDGSTTFAPTITNVGSAVSLNGNGLSQTLAGTALVPDTGAGSGNGNATITFPGNGLASVTFTLDNGAAFPSPQSFALFNVSYLSAVPEVNPPSVATAICAGAAAIYIRRRRSRPATIT